MQVTSCQLCMHACRQRAGLSLITLNFSVTARQGAMLAAANVSCSTVGQAKLYLKVYSAFAILAALAYISAIALIVKSMAYRQFIHRLTFYLAVGGLIRTLEVWLEIAPVDIEESDESPVTVRQGWDGVCVFSGIVIQYLAFVQTFTVLWICFYIFMLVVYNKQLRQRRHEVSGITTIILAPLLFIWEPFVTDSYGLSGTKCWIKNNCKSDPDLSLAYVLAISTVPVFLVSLLGVILLTAAIVSLVRKASQKFLQHQHWLAVREILPLTDILPSLLFANISRESNSRGNL